MSASQSQIEDRQSKEIQSQDLEGKKNAIDVFKGQDGFIRDLSSVHRTYKRMKQTSQAIEIIADFYKKEKIKRIYCFFDEPVSNSGRLKKMIEEVALENKYDWRVELVYNPDKVIEESNWIAMTSDAWILDNASANFNLMKYILLKMKIKETIFLVNKQ